VESAGYEPVTGGVSTETVISTTTVEGADADWWSQVQADLAQREYHLSPVDGVYQAPNRAHDLRTSFEKGAVRVVPRTGEADWAWHWTLTGFGRVGEVRPAGDAVLNVSDNRAEYHYPGLTEWYVNDERGLEQGFTISERPAGEGLLLLEARTNLEVVGDDEAVLRHEGEIVLRYGDLAVWDAAGRRR